MLYASVYARLHHFEISLPHITPAEISAVKNVATRKLGLVSHELVLQTKLKIRTKVHMLVPMGR